MRLKIVFCLFTVLFLAVPAIQVSFAAIEISIDGNFDDWASVPVLIEDPDDVGEDNGDIKAVRVHSTEDTLFMMLTVYGTAAPQDGQRYYYHILIDADNDINTGFDNSMYEGIPTGVKDSIGGDFYVQVGRRNGADDGIEVYFLDGATDQVVASDFSWLQGGDSMEIAVPFDMFNALQDLGEIFKVGQTIAIASFQEGDANGWEVDWTEPGKHVVGSSAAVKPDGKLPVTWATLKQL